MLQKGEVDSKHSTSFEHSCVAFLCVDRFFFCPSEIVYDYRNIYWQSRRVPCPCDCLRVNYGQKVCLDPTDFWTVLHSYFLVDLCTTQLKKNTKLKKSYQASLKQPVKFEKVCFLAYLSKIWIQFSSSVCVTLRKLPNFPMPQFVLTIKWG